MEEVAGEFLTKEELTTLTGYKTPARQMMWLDENGWRYIKNRNNSPIISRHYCRQRLSDGVPEAHVQGWEREFEKGLASLRH